MKETKLTFARMATALLAGLATPVAFAPYDFYLLAILSPTVLFWLWSSAERQAAGIIGFCFGLGMFGFGAWWVQVSVHQFGLPLYSFSIGITVGFVLVLSIFPAICGYLANAVPAAVRAARVLWLYPTAWTLTELLRGWIFTGFPWLLLGYSQVDSPLAVYAPIFGVYGVSFVASLIAAAIVVGVAGSVNYRVLGVTVIGVVVVGAVLLSDLRWTKATSDAKSVALVQGAVPQAVKWSHAYRQPSIDLYTELTAPHWGKSLVVWPETAIPAFAAEVPETMALLRERADTSDTTLLVGMPTTSEENDTSYFNSVVQIGGPQTRYDKRHLVPFGEYLPFDRWVRPLTTFLRIPMSNFSPGAAQQSLFQGAGYQIGVSICYEDAYAREVARALPGANVLVNVSNDAWFGDSIAPHQHLQIARMRALENERYLLRATNTGISAIIDEKGTIVARSKQFEPDVISGIMIPRSGATPASKFGVLGALLACAVALVFFGLTSARQRNR